MSSSRFPPGAGPSHDSLACPPTPWQSPQTAVRSYSSSTGLSEHGNLPDGNTNDSGQIEALDSRERSISPLALATASTNAESHPITFGTGAFIEPQTSVLISSTSSLIQTSPSIAIEASSVPLPPSPPIVFTHCTECEENNPDYVSCIHPEDTSSYYVASPETSHLSPVSAFVQPPVGSELTARSGMLRSRALTALFDENLDETAKSIL